MTDTPHTDLRRRLLLGLLVMVAAFALGAVAFWLLIEAIVS